MSWLATLDPRRWLAALTGATQAPAPPLEEPADLPPPEPHHVERAEGQGLIEAELQGQEHAHIRRALELWASGILSPGQRPTEHAAPNLSAINEAVRSRAIGGGWDWLKDDHGHDWCGHFASRAFGSEMPLDVRQRVMPSTYRLMAHGPAAGLRRVAIPEAGDVMVVGTSKRWGDHICLVVGVVDGLAYTVEGNARGWVPGGRFGVAEDARHGVIRRTRLIGPASRLRCPVSGLAQSSGYHSAYRWEGGA